MNVLLLIRRIFDLKATFFQDMAEGIVAYERGHFQQGDIQWKSFEDGFPNLVIKNVSQLHNRNVVILVDFLNPQEMFAQLSILYTLPRYVVRSLTIVLPYFPTGTMERVDYEGQIATAYTLARLLSSVPLTLTGPAKLVIYDIHALQERFYFGDSILPILETALPLFLDVLRNNHAKEPIAVAFPDEGAQKRFGINFPSDIPQILCSKVRDGDKRVVRVKEGDPTGHHVFIVDDLVKSGGTLLECRHVLMSQGALRVSAFVTHAVFPNDSWKNFVGTPDRPGAFTHFYTTDSCPTVAQKLEEVGDPFRIITLASTLARLLLTF